MASKSQTGDEVEQSLWTEEDLKDYAITGSVEKLGTPMISAEYGWSAEKGDHYKVECPYCEGELHYHQTKRHPRVAFGGISPAYCEEHRELYYLSFISSFDLRLPGLIIHEARRRLANYPGEKFQKPLIPRGVDPRIVDDILREWTEGDGTKYD